MDDRLDFLVYCIESYKNSNGLKGREYIVDDLNIYINTRKQVDAGVVH